MQSDDARAAGEGVPAGTPDAKTAPKDPPGAVSLRAALVSGLVVLLVLAAAVYFSLHNGTEVAPPAQRTAQDVPRPVVDTLPRPAESVPPQPAQQLPAPSTPPQSIGTQSAQPAQQQPAPSAPPPAVGTQSAQPAQQQPASAPPPAVVTQSPPLAPPPGSETAQPQASVGTQGANAAPAPMADQAAALPRGEMVTVQGARVRIRAEPSRRGSVLGTATKGMQFKVVGRTRSWVQVETEAGKGWIGAGQLRPSN